MNGEYYPVSRFKSRGGVGRIFRALGYSVSGLLAALRFESAFRQELVLIAVTTALAVVARLPLVEWVLLALSMGLVLVTELLNSAVETVVDRISLDRHLLSKRAKDMASAAVLVSICCLLFTFAMLVVPRLAVQLGMVNGKPD
jgi:diacylglycerol kinase (ATP)